MRRGYDSMESELATTIAAAAAAFAVHSVDEETRAKYQRKMIESFKAPVQAAGPKSRKEDTVAVPPDSGRLSRRSTARGTRESGGSLRSYLRPIDAGGTQKGNRKVESKADIWEKAQLEKVSKWYEKTNTKILGWENEKKKKAKVLKQSREAELERLTKEISLHYRNKLEWIDGVAGGARTKLEEKRRNDESKILKKANGMRATGRTPVNCFCFEFYRLKKNQ